MQGVMGLNDAGGSEVFEVDFLLKVLFNDFLLLNGVENVEFGFLTVPERRFDEDSRLVLGKRGFDFELIGHLVDFFNRNLDRYQDLSYLSLGVWLHVVDPIVLVLLEVHLIKLSKNEILLPTIEGRCICND